MVKFYDTVGELVVYLQTLDQDMPLGSKDGGGMFTRGQEVDIMKMRKMKGNHHYAFHADDKIFKDSAEGTEFDMAWIN